MKKLACLFILLFSVNAKAAWYVSFEYLTNYVATHANTNSGSTLNSNQLAVLRSAVTNFYGTNFSFNTTNYARTDAQNVWFGNQDFINRDMIVGADSTGQTFGAPSSLTINTKKEFDLFLPTYNNFPSPGATIFDAVSTATNVYTLTIGGGVSVFPLFSGPINMTQIYFATSAGTSWTIDSSGNFYPLLNVSLGTIASRIPSGYFTNLFSISETTSNLFGQTVTGVTALFTNLNVRGFTASIITNNGLLWISVATNANPSFVTAPNGSLCTTTNGSLFVRSNSLWVLK